MKTLGLAAEGALPGSGVGEAKQDVGLVKVDRMEIGGIAIDRQLSAAVDLTRLMKRVEGVDDAAGIVGYELLKRFPARIDYANSKLVFYRPETFRYAGRGTRVPFVFSDHIPQVRGRVDGIEGAFHSMNVDMIFNFPSQTEEMLRRDVQLLRESGCNQTTFYPLMASPVVGRELARTVGKVDYAREARFYEILSDGLTADGAKVTAEHWFQSHRRPVAALLTQCRIIARMRRSGGL